MLVKLGFDAEKWKTGIKQPILWNTDKVPHLLVSGITGGGKTVLSQIIINQLLNTTARLMICDYKAGGDWDGIVKDYAEYNDCDTLLDNFFSEFNQIIENKSHEDIFLVFDEFSTYALAKDSKEFKELMSKISRVAFMGRSFGFHLIFISQQFNAKVLDTAIREQFGIKIYMGSSISTESAMMLFPNCEIDKSKHLRKQCGYLTSPEKELQVIQIPYIENPYRLKQLLVSKGQVR